jgi:glycosyltransferase involved in cell wall biosynthesis
MRPASVPPRGPLWYNSPVRILHVISGLDPQNGGPTAALVGLAPAQIAAGLDVTILSTWKIRDGFPVADSLRARGVKVIHVGPAKGKLSKHPMLKHHLTAAVAAADVVHVHAMWEQAQYEAGRAARRRGVPYVITPHGMLDPFNMTRNAWAKRLFLELRLRANLEHAAALHFATPMERDAVARLRLRAPAIVEPLGLDLAEFRELPPRGRFREKHPSLKDRPVVMFLGRLHAGKGLELLIPAFARAKLPGDAMLVIAGPDSYGFHYSDEAKRLAAEHAIADRVLFTGMLHGPERIAALVDADLFALPSYHENFGIAAAEAMAAGLAVIVSDQVYQHPEISEHQLGAVVPLAVEPLAAELERWIADADLRRQAGERGRAFALEHYDWNVIAQNWKGHYERLGYSSAVRSPE